MPDRILRAGILDSKAFNDLTEEAEILYRRLLSVVDDFGGYEADPELLRVKCFWRQKSRWPHERIVRALADICAQTREDGSKLMRVFEHKGKSFLKIYNLGKPRAKQPRYPQPPEDACEHVHAGCEHVHADACRVQADVGSVQASVRYSNTTTTTNTTTNKESKEEEARCEEFRDLYPAHRLDNYGATCFISSSDQDGILARLRLAVKSDDWTRENGRYVPKASKWVLDGAPAPAAQPDPASAPPSVVSTMDPETRRRLDERRRNA
jgi:hypothetical protein